MKRHLETVALIIFWVSHSGLKPNWIEAKQILKFGDALSTMAKGKQNSQ